MFVPRRSLPPLNAVRAFEAAARLGSFKEAAAELSVTHGAVSQQIRRLEVELGARLFARTGNNMAPTPEALRLAGEVGRGLDILRNAVARFEAAAEREAAQRERRSPFRPGIRGYRIRPRRHR